MADESRNPADRADLRRLESELQDVKGLLRNELAQARSERERQGVQQRRQSETRAGEEARTRRRLPEAGRRPPIEADSAAIRRDTEVIAEGQERAARAGERFEQSLRNQQRLLPRARSIQLGEGTRIPPSYNEYGGVIPPGAGAPPPPPPPPPPAPPGGPGGEGPRGGRNLRETIDGYRRQADAAREASAANAGYGRSLSESIAYGARYDDSLRRHGALTTEFFAALARGEITLGEFRYQLGATIAKFAGWTAASVLVFGALDAVRELGKGALDASSGVNQLSRYVTNIDTDKAQAQFVELARHFNLPIGDVANAMAQMGQIFHNQDQAFTATKAALLGVKTGQLELADSTRFSIAITRAFGLGADQLTPVFDRLNRAQNQFGVGIRDTAAGVAKAGGVWHAAGGDIDTLTALIVAGEAKTGRSGEEMGTAFQRSAEILKRGTSKNAQELARYGIDAAAPVNEIYDKAFRLVQSGKVQGSEVTRLAKALSTPQLAGRISPILQDPDFYKKVRRQIDPKQSAGESERELNKVLDSAAEKIKKIGTNLQTLGAEFARSGAAAPLGALLGGLNKALELTTDLFSAFNSLPHGLREAVTVGLEFAAVMKVLSRFGVSLPGSGVEVTARRNASIERDFLRGQAQGATAEITAARFDKATAARLESQGETDAAERLRKTAAEREATATARLAEAEAQLEAVTRTRIAAGEGAVAAGAGGAGRAASTAETAGVVAAGDRAAAAAEGKLPVNEAASAAFGDRAAALGSEGKRLGDVARRSNLSTHLVADGLTRGRQAVEGARTTIRASGQRLAQLGTSMLDMIGPIDVLIAGGFALYDIHNQVKQATDNATAAIRKGQTEGSPQALQAAADKARSEAKKTTPGVLDFFANNVPGVGESAKMYFGYGKSEDQLNKYAGNLDQIAKETKQAQKGGLLLDQSTIRNNLNRRLAVAHTVTQQMDAYEQAALEFRQSNVEQHGARGQYQPGPEARAAAKGTWARIQAGIGDLKASEGYIHQALLLITDADKATAFMTQLGNRVERRGFKPNLQRAYGAAAARFRELAGQESDPTKQKALFDLANQAEQDGLQKAQERLQRLTGPGSTPGTQVRARRDYLASVRRILLTGFEQQIKGIDAAIKQKHKQLDEIRKTIETVHIPGLPQFDYKVKGNPAAAAEVLGQIAGLEAGREAVTSALKDNRQQYGAIADETKQSNKQTLQELASTQLARFQAAQGMATARFSIGANQGAMLQRQLSDAQAYAARVKSYGKRLDPQEYMNAMRAVYEAQKAIADYTREQASAMLQAEEAYQLAGIDPGNAVAVARLRERFARRAQSETPGQSPAERRQQQADVRQTHADTVRARQQQAYDDIQFQADMGRITRDVEVRQLQQLLRTIHGNRDLRRQIQRQIYQLKHAADQSDWDMNLGNVRLPSLYEIRRAIAGNRQGVSVAQSYATTIVVQRPQDAALVGKQMDRYQSGTGAAVARAVGMR